LEIKSAFNISPFSRNRKFKF